MANDDEDDVVARVKNAYFRHIQYYINEYDQERKTRMRTGFLVPFFFSLQFMRQQKSIN